MNFSKIAKMLLSFSLLCCFCLSANVLTEADFQKAQAMKDGKVYVDQTTKAKTNGIKIKSLGDIEIKNDIKSLDLDIMQTKNDKEAVNVHPNQAKIDYYNDLKANSTGETYSSRDCADTDNGATDVDGDGCAPYQASWCALYDDDDFDSMAMCCICGGGEEVAAEGCDEGETEYSWAYAGAYASEVSWTLTDADGVEAAAGNGGSGDICLADGTYLATMIDSYGDGWNGAVSFSDSDGNVVVVISMSACSYYEEYYGECNGSIIYADVTFGGAPPVGGCTDPNAPNYNADAEVDDGTCEAYCAGTTCGSYFESGYTCEDLAGYGIDCSVCEAAGECPAPPPCYAFDCAGNCADGNESWATDGYCDGVDEPYGLNFDCPEWGCDDGQCGTVDLGDGTCGVVEDTTCDGCEFD